MENLHFVVATKKKLEMTLHSDNDYDVTNAFFLLLKSSWPILYSPILYS